jgi:hypothetical protein
MFVRKYIVPALAIMGVTYAVFTVMGQSKPIVPAPPVNEPATSPYDQAVAGAGIVEASIDGAAPVKVNLFLSFSKGLHYPRTVLFADGLSKGSHTLRLTVCAEKDPASNGHAFRALHFVANDGR